MLIKYIRTVKFFCFFSQPRRSVWRKKKRRCDCTCVCITWGVVCIQGYSLLSHKNEFHILKMWLKKPHTQTEAAGQVGKANSVKKKNFLKRTQKERSAFPWYLRKCRTWKGDTERSLWFELPGVARCFRHLWLTGWWTQLISQHRSCDLGLPSVTAECAVALAGLTLNVRRLLSGHDPLFQGVARSHFQT